MKTIITIAAVLVLSACGVVTEKDLVGVTPDEAPEDTRIPGGWFLWDQVDTTSMCGNDNNNPGGHVDIPCHDVLNVCVQGHDGTMDPKWLSHIYRCTDQSPTWRDVCRTVPVEQWAFYGYTPEECASA